MSVSVCVRERKREKDGASECLSGWVCVCMRCSIARVCVCVCV